MKYLICLLIFFSSCHSFSVDVNLKEFVLNHFKEKKSGYIHFDKFDSVDWNKMYIITAYPTSQNFDATVFPYADEILDTGVEENDNIIVILLFKNRKMVNLTTFDADEAPFFTLRKMTKEGKFTYYRKSDAVFKYYWTKSGLKEPPLFFNIEHVQ